MQNVVKTLRSKLSWQRYWSTFWCWNVHKNDIYKNILLFLCSVLCAASPLSDCVTLDEGGQCNFLSNYTLCLGTSRIASWSTYLNVHFIVFAVSFHSVETGMKRNVKSLLLMDFHTNVFMDNNFLNEFKSFIYHWPNYKFIISIVSITAVRWSDLLFYIFFNKWSE